MQLFAAVVSLLTELSARTLVALLIDDIQSIDEASVSLLHYVIRAFDGRCPVVIAATARQGELIDNAPAYRLVRGLAREGRLAEIPLGPLDEHACATLARSMAPDTDIAPVVAASEGNPLLTLELARALASGEDTVPASIETVLAEHLSRPEGRRVRCCHGQPRWDANSTSAF